jgi:hypothetical protein
MATTIQTELLSLQIPQPPNLSVAPPQYTAEYINQLNNILRLYFNRLTNALASLSGDEGGRFLQMPYGAFHYDYTTTLTSTIASGATTIPVASTIGFSTTGAIIIENEVITYTGITATSFTGCTRGAYGSTAASHTSGSYVGGAQGTTAATRTLLQINTTDYANGFSLNSSSALVAEYTGVYNIQFSVQTFNFDNAPDDFTIWLTLNGTDVASTASIATTPAKHGGLPGAAIVAANFFQQLTAGDYIQFYWTTDSGNTIIVTYPPSTSPVHPASPAAVVTVSFVSAAL